ncbi:hypothetical protein HPB47_006030 [Ixodes persulcatus]|uniref:Uncharacterized protein n=1 Tax=Ixodes persulcatus TaxID=34615 RepID=A0AC60PBR7_IXOPE|nr:hypothetical protein HPB47_006030 [Ixodes persulcatus]
MGPAERAAMRWSSPIGADDQVGDRAPVASWSERACQTGPPVTRRTSVVSAGRLLACPCFAPGLREERWRSREATAGPGASSEECCRARPCAGPVSATDPVAACNRTCSRNAAAVCATPRCMVVAPVVMELLLSSAPFDELSAAPPPPPPPPPPSPPLLSVRRWLPNGV